MASIKRPPNASYTWFGFIFKKKKWRKIQSEIEVMSSNDYANRLSSQPPLSRHLPVPRERPINGGSTVEVSPDFAFCMTIIRDFSKPCLTKNVFFTWKGTYWRIPCGNNSERLGIWQCMQGDSCRAFLPLGTGVDYYLEDLGSWNLLNCFLLLCFCFFHF